MSERPLILCLLPVRNGEHLLDGWFDSVGRFADKVVALDDGSTDGTRERLERHPLVGKVLTNPVRPTYEGWDDHANRSRLLEAAACWQPQWIVQLDADERMPADDAEVMRDFLATAADRDCAYCLPVHRMIDDLEHHDGRIVWVGRIFKWEPGQRFPERRLHFVALPTSIPRERWINTTFRLQHLGALTARERAARYRKYRESDPHGEFQSDYERVTRVTGARLAWEPRPPSLPAEANGAWHREAEAARAAHDEPAISAVVIARNDEDVVADALQAVVDQECAEPFEVIAVVSGTDRTADIVRERFPGVRLIELEGVALPGRARNAGLAVARGRYVSFPGSHTRVLPGTLAARLAAHRQGYAMVSSTMINGTRTPCGWASYFLDHNTVLPGRPPGPMDLSPAHCSYLREALTQVGGFREDLRAGEDTLVNDELFKLGYGAWFTPHINTVHHTPCRTLRLLVRHHFTRGRGFAIVLLAQQSPGTRFLNRRRAGSLVLKLIPSRLLRVQRAVREWGDTDLERRWRRVALLSTVAVVSSWIGLWTELLGPGRHHRVRLLFGKKPSA